MQKRYETVGNFNNECILGTKITKLKESLLSHILGTKEITKFPLALVTKDHLRKHLTLVGGIPISLKQM